MVLSWDVGNSARARASSTGRPDFLRLGRWDLAFPIRTRPRIVWPRHHPVDVYRYPGLESLEMIRFWAPVQAVDLKSPASNERSQSAP